MGRNICPRNLYCPPLGKLAWTTIASKAEKDVYTAWIGPSKKVFTQNWSRWWPLSIKLNSTNELQRHLSNKGEVRLKSSIKVGWKCTIVGRDYRVEIAATKTCFWHTSGHLACTTTTAWTRWSIMSTGCCK